MHVHFTITILTHNKTDTFYSNSIRNMKLITQIKESQTRSKEEEK